MCFSFDSHQIPSQLNLFYHFQVSLRRRKREVLVEEIVSQEEAQGLPSSELDAVENQLKWASWELHSLRHCGEDRNSVWAGE